MMHACMNLVKKMSTLMHAYVCLILFLVIHRQMARYVQAQTERIKEKEKGAKTKGAQKVAADGHLRAVIGLLLRLLCLPFNPLPFNPLPFNPLLSARQIWFLSAV